MESKPDKFDVLTADVETIQGLLSCGNITSENLVDLYLAQISKHDGFLHAMIETASREILLRQAHDLDTERRAGNIRGPPHGIPIIIKDNIATHPTLGLGTTAGSLALVGSKPRKNATIVDMLVRKGAIILGKSNLSSLTLTFPYVCRRAKAAIGSTDRSRGPEITPPGVFLTGSWEDISVATLDPKIWKLPDTFIKPVPEADQQALKDITEAYNAIRAKAKRFVENVPLTTVEAFNYNGENRADMKPLLNDYLKGLEESKEVVHDNQDFFIQTQEQSLTAEQYEKTLEHLRSISRDHGIDRILREFDVDVIIGPADSFITSLATGSGYPVAGMPLSYLDFNGRPLGVAALAGKNQDAALVKLMSAWEATFPKRKPPPQLVE
ncbi:putative glutamyl-tRNA amidotransferase subunit A [Hypoxylon rubiginosum]|uniref:Glutamyl-tRNA amidotransferase subunit A n=1 Tax=Hypoxylon rubiginosum TaxID=110542 RepID=A0ACB9ZGP3_9PEZI|nr:putative glutamyl-tRNA amidotransferase subunit A [Hypoxylon rubiginosum]